MLRVSLLGVCLVIATVLSCTADEYPPPPPYVLQPLENPAMWLKLSKGGSFPKPEEFKCTLSSVTEQHQSFLETRSRSAVAGIAKRRKKGGRQNKKPLVISNLFRKSMRPRPPVSRAARNEAFLKTMETERRAKRDTTTCAVQTCQIGFACFVESKMKAQQAINDIYGRGLCRLRELIEHTKPNSELDKYASKVCRAQLEFKSTAGPYIPVVGREFPGEIWEKFLTFFQNIGADATVREDSQMKLGATAACNLDLNKRRSKVATYLDEVAHFRKEARDVYEYDLGHASEKWANVSPQHSQRVHESATNIFNILDKTYAALLGSLGDLFRLEDGMVRHVKTRSWCDITLDVFTRSDHHIDVHPGICNMWCKEPINWNGILQFVNTSLHTFELCWKHGFPNSAPCLTNAAQMDDFALWAEEITPTELAGTRGKDTLQAAKRAEKATANMAVDFESHPNGTHWTGIHDAMSSHTAPTRGVIISPVRLEGGGELVGLADNANQLK